MTPVSAHPALNAPVTLVGGQVTLVGPLVASGCDLVANLRSQVSGDRGVISSVTGRVTLRSAGIALVGIGVAAFASGVALVGDIIPGLGGVVVTTGIDIALFPVDITSVCRTVAPVSDVVTSLRDSGATRATLAGAAHRVCLRWGDVIARAHRHHSRLRVLEVLRWTTAHDWTAHHRRPPMDTEAMNSYHSGRLAARPTGA